MAESLAAVQRDPNNGPRCSDCGKHGELRAKELRLYCASCFSLRRERARWEGMLERLEKFVEIVGERYRDAYLADFGLAGPGIEFYRRVTTEKRDPIGWLIVGSYGIGKTHIGAAALRLWLGAGRTVRFVSARRLFREIRDTYSPGATITEGQVAGWNTDPDLLVIDDLGREGRPTEQVLSVLHDIIDERIRHMRATVITTNLGDNLADLYGPAMESRLALFETFVFEGPDRRKLPTTTNYGELT